MLCWNQFSSSSPVARAGAVPAAAPPMIHVRGVGFHAVTEQQCIAWIMAELEARRGGWALTANLDHLRRLVRTKEYAALCAGATLVVADGMPVVWASRVQGTPLPQRVAGSDLVSSLSGAAAATGRSVYLLGGDPGTAEDAAGVLSKRFPGLCIAGFHCPAMGFEKEPRTSHQIERLIRQASPDIVYVALGSPKQERLIASLRAAFPGVWWLGVGVSFSFLCGRVRRAPRWVQAIGCEWVHRLLQEPSRLAGRYLRDDLPFAAGLFVRVAGRRLLRRGGSRAD
jgi:N-acetylglucosaminyldiphosphoundecaprenol N-acetyl-beta-D-mannosaminyltransferase